MSWKGLWNWWVISNSARTTCGDSPGYMLSWIGVTKCEVLAWTCIQIHLIKDIWPKRKRVNEIEWKCIQFLIKEGKLDPCISLQLCLTRAFKNWLLSTLFIESTQRRCIFIFQLYLHQKIKLTSLQLRTLRKTEPRRKQIVSERWSACPLTPLHPSLAEKERYYRVKSVFKHFTV